MIDFIRSHTPEQLELLRALAAEDTLSPRDKPGEVWTRCPVCEPVGPCRHRLTITLHATELTISCRKDCPSDRVRGLLLPRAGQRPSRGTAGPRPTSLDSAQTARETRTPTPHADTPRGRSDRRSDSRSDTGSSFFFEDEEGSLVDPSGELARRQRKIDRLAFDPEAVNAALPFLGIDRPRKRFPCPLPKHRRPARLYRKSARHSFTIACSCARGRPTNWSLADVHAAQAGRDPGTLSALELAVWFRHLFFLAGALEPVPVPVPPLPGATRKHADVRDGFELLLGLRWPDYPGQPVAYGKHFAAAWSGTAPSTAQLALKAMKAHNVMVDAGQMDDGTKLYLPGPVTA